MVARTPSCKMSNKLILGYEPLIPFLRWHNPVLQMSNTLLILGCEPIVRPEWSPYRSVIGYRIEVPASYPASQPLPTEVSFSTLKGFLIPYRVHSYP